MSILEIIKQRRSYRLGYTERRVSRSELQQLLEAVYEAPSGCNLQTVEAIAVLDAELLQKVHAIVDKRWVNSATAGIVLISRPLAKQGFGDSRYKEDFGAAAENLLLQAQAMGLASCWIQGGIEGDKAQAIHDLLSVPAEAIVMGYFPLGEPLKSATPPPRKPIAERCFIDEYGKSAF